MVSATPLNGPTNNPLLRLEFGQLVNARATVNGRPAASNATIPIQAGTFEVRLVVERVMPGQAATVPFTVVDGCGPWPTFVGGGPDAF